ncbi:hypothetical protein AALP_AA7G178200 [Arabis alpina]|uniref:Uncharacterized protein n=1 Tax=Arabis alpina TaxID=50452 RepID=A0A087GIS6_ARAAL|nr:hypothetical protein AALP_AA7G178200 [Arabis alpina]
MAEQKAREIQANKPNATEPLIEPRVPTIQPPKESARRSNGSTPTTGRSGKGRDSQEIVSVDARPSNSSLARHEKKDGEDRANKKRVFLAVEKGKGPADETSGKKPRRDTSLLPPGAQIPPVLALTDSEDVTNFLKSPSAAVAFLSTVIFPGDEFPSLNTSQRGSEFGEAALLILKLLASRRKTALLAEKDVCDERALLSTETARGTSAREEAAKKIKGLEDKVDSLDTYIKRRNDRVKELKSQLDEERKEVARLSKQLKSFENTRNGAVERATAAARRELTGEFEDRASRAHMKSDKPPDMDAELEGYIDAKKELCEAYVDYDKLAANLKKELILTTDPFVEIVSNEQLELAVGMVGVRDQRASNEGVNGMYEFAKEYASGSKDGEPLVVGSSLVPSAEGSEAVAEKSAKASVVPTVEKTGEKVREPEGVDDPTAGGVQDGVSELAEANT